MNALLTGWFAAESDELSGLAGPILLAIVITVVLGILALSFLLFSGTTIKNSKHPTQFDKFAGIYFPIVSVVFLAFWLLLDRHNKHVITSGTKMLGELAWGMFLTSLILGLVLFFKKLIIRINKN